MSAEWRRGDFALYIFFIDIYSLAMILFTLSYLWKVSWVSRSSSGTRRWPPATNRTESDLLAPLCGDAVLTMAAGKPLLINEKKTQPGRIRIQILKYLEPYPEFWPTLDPGLCNKFWRKQFSLNKILFKKIMAPEEIFSQLQLWMVNFCLKSYTFCL